MSRRAIVALRRSALLLVLTAGLGPLWTAGGSTSVAVGASTPSCAGKALSVTTHTWIYNPSARGTVFEVLPITITNHGPTCVLAGTPKIAPTLAGARRAIVGADTVTIIVGATAITTPARSLTLRPGHAAYTYLTLTYPVGHTATAQRWKRICQPMIAPGLTVYVVPGRSLWNRHVATAVPEVCTTGRANDLRSGPLARSPAH